MIGQRIGNRYKLLSVLGEGGMSRVYLAHDMILDRDVAVKILHYDFEDEQELEKRFQREALSATSLSHPNIVSIYDVGEDDRSHYLVMEYVKGETLKSYVQRVGPLSPKRAVEIMQQLTSAIAHAHHNGIVHRDIKPQNVLVDEDGTVKITDFGIAMALHATAHTKTNSVVGTVHYLSPEQARGGMATKRSDLYSLGIVFYELLTGELPFAAETAVAIALKHLQEDIPSVRAKDPSIPQSVENVILKSTAKKIEDRYESADAMYDDLITVLDDDRRNEPRYTVFYDEDATKVMPAIKEVKEEQLEKEETVAPLPKQEEPKKRSKKGWWIGGGLLLVIGLLLLPLILSTPKVEVPDVVGLEEVEARDQVTASGLKVKEAIEGPSDEQEKGHVFRTVPKAGDKRESGSDVTLYVSTGKETVPFGNYVGKPFDQATRQLAELDFSDIEVERMFSDYDEGVIVEQNISPGAEVIPAETTVHFKVSKGQEMKKLAQLVGKTESELNEYAEESGFDIRIVREEFSEKVEAGHVISQRPEAGEKMKKGDVVDVVLSKGPPAKPLKQIVQSVFIPYEEPEWDEEEEEEPEREEQWIRIYVQDRKHSMTDPVEEFSITKDMKKRITIELEEGQRGGYRIMRNNTVIEEEMFDYKDAK